MFKVINSIVQHLAKFLAFGTGFVFVFITWILAQINTFITVGDCLLIWIIYKISTLINLLFALAQQVSSEIAILAFMFALDISKEEHAEQLEIIEEKLDQEIYLNSMKVRRAAKHLKEKMDVETKSDEPNNDPS